MRHSGTLAQEERFDRAHLHALLLPTLAARISSSTMQSPTPLRFHWAMRLVSIASSLVALLGSGNAHAVDGCLVMLCLAAPDYRNIPQCVDPVRQLLHDLARGEPFPSCASGDGNGAGNQWSAAPTFCPPQYTISTDGESATTYACDYQGAITVTVNGTMFTRTWWNEGGDTVTEFSPAAKAQLGTWDSKFDDDYAAWSAGHPSSPDIPDAP